MGMPVKKEAVAAAHLLGLAGRNVAIAPSHLAAVVPSRRPVAAEVVTREAAVVADYHAATLVPVEIMVKHSGFSIALCSARTVAVALCQTRSDIQR